MSIKKTKYSRLIFGISVAAAFIIIAIALSVGYIYIQRAERVLGESRIESIQNKQITIISEADALSTEMIKFSHKMFDDGELTSILSQKAEGENLYRYYNFLASYKYLTNSSDIVIYRKSSESFVTGVRDEMKQRIFDNAVYAYKNGSSFLCQKEDGKLYVTYAISNYRGYITVFLLNDGAVSDILKSDMGDCDTYLFNDEIFIASDKGGGICSLYELVGFVPQTSGFKWVGGQLCVYMKSGSYMVVSVFDKKVFSEEVSESLKGFRSTFIAIVLLIFLGICVFYFTARKLAEKYFLYSDTKSDDDIKMSDLIYNVCNYERLTPEQERFSEEYFGECAEFVCMIMQCDSFSEILYRKSGTEASEMMAEVEAVCFEKLAKHGKAVTVRTARDCICIAVSGDEGLFDGIEADINEIRESIYENYKITFTFTLSGKNAGVSELSAIFKELNERKENRFMSGKNAIIGYDAFRDADNDASYPESAEKGILEALDEQNHELFYERLEEFVRYAGKCSAVNAKNYIIRLAFSLLRNSTQLRGNKNLTVELMDKLYASETIDTSINILMTMMPQTTLSEDDDANDFYYDVMQVIMEEYNNPCIDLTFMSERLGMTPYYIGVKIKNTFGKPFSDVLMEYRVKKAEYLLVNSEQKVQDIAAGCGFTSSGYFVRVFKKYKGETPGNYRKIHG